MKKPRRPFQSKAFYLRLANAAREITDTPITHQELLETDPAKRSATLKLAAEKLRGTVFDRGSETKVAGDYLVARLYLQTFQRIIAARKPKQNERLPITFEGLANEIVVTPAGKVKMVVSSLFYGRYSEFLRDLERFNVDRIKRCPQCGTIFEGRRNSVCCGDSCGQKQWRQQNPEDYQFIQQKSQRNKKARRQVTKLSKEREAVSRIPNQLPPVA